MQPVLGARMLFRDPELLRAALVPAGLLAAFCACLALLDPFSWSVGGVVRRFYTVFAVLAPLPSVLLARHYAKLAALARHKFGFGPVEPCIEPFRLAVSRAFKQFVLVAVGVVPLTFALKFVPFFGPLIIHVVLAVWALHWIVVDAFDSARVLQPGQKIEDLDALAEKVRQPWFVRLLLQAEGRVPVVGRILARFGRWCDRLARPWREEIALVEEHPSLMVGFALSTAALVATPVLNLLFRPIVLIGAAHVLGRLEAHAEPELPPPPATLPPPPSDVTTAA